MAYTILIAEDDVDIVNILKLYMESGGYQVLTADNGVSAYELIETKHVDLAIVDIMMPKMNGFELVSQVRKTKNIPILILTAKIEDNDKILGLNLGADDYLTKPFNPLEILARVNANLRRFYHLGGGSQETTESTIILKELKLDTETFTLTKNNIDIPLTMTEYKLLYCMMKTPNRVYTKSQLCEAINGEYFDNYENSIMVHISHLREKIEDDPKNPQYIKNVRGVGYKIEKV